MVASPDISKLLTTADYIVFIIILCITLLFVLWGHLKKPKEMNEADSFLDAVLMGRKLTLPMFVMTLVATWYGGVFGVSQIAFNYGIFNFITQGVFWYLTYIIFALFIVKRIKAYNAITLPDLIGQMFGSKSEKLAGIMNIFNLIPVVYTISLGLLLKMIFNIPLNLGMIIGVSFVLLYSLLGGFRSVVFSDIFQFFIMLSAIMMVVVISYFKFDFAILTTLPDYYFSPLSKFTILETLSWGLIALSTLVDPNFYQRCFAAESFSTAKKGILISTLIWIIFDLSLTFGAMYAKAMIPAAEPQYGYFLYALQILPDGMRGFFLAGISATILSTLDSYIFLAGSTISYDMVPKRFRGKLSIHYLGIVCVAVLSIFMAQIFEGNIKDIWKTLGSVSSSALLIPVLFGHIFKGKLSDNAFFCSSSLGAMGTIYWRLSGMKQTYQLDEIYIGMSCATLGILGFLLFSKLKRNFTV
jgi:SSS family solute:Na+ symporter